MRRHFWAISALAFLSTLTPALADRRPACLRTALEQLRAQSPDGLSVYRTIGDRSFFEGMIRCEDPQYDLSTAVHESTHIITSEKNAFPLIGGGAVAIVPEMAQFYPPSRIAGRFKPDDFSTIYLKLGQASSATDFTYLLDELNAYSHDLNAAVDLKDVAPTEASVDHRDGLAALMAFVAVYAEHARASEPETWRGLRESAVATTIRTLWGQAERVMAKSCGVPDFGTTDKDYIRRYCAKGTNGALATIIQRVPACPTACLETVETTTVEPTMLDQKRAISDEPAAPRQHAGVPSWFAKMVRLKQQASAATSFDETATEETR